MNKLLSLICNLVMLCMLAACSSEDDVPQPDQEPTPAPSGEPVGRSVLVYVSAHNNLGQQSTDSSGATTQNDRDDINEMIQAAQNGDLGANRLIVFHSQWKGDTQLKEITASGAKVLKTYSADFSPTSDESMREVIADFKELAPANSYGLVLWGHGSGWLEDGMQNAPSARSYGAYEYSTNKWWWMNTTTLAQVLKDQNFDFLYFDCCFMASVEVAYELRDAVPAIIASSSELPAEGMPYHKTLKYLMTDTPNLVEAARTTFNYFDAMSYSARTCTMSVINTSALATLAEEIRKEYLAVTATPQRSTIQQFVSASDYTYRNLYFDLRHTLETICGTPLSNEIETALADAVTFQAATPYIWQTEPGHTHWPYEVKVDHHSGLTTYIPTSLSDITNNRNNYGQLQWATDVAINLFSK